MRTKKPEQNRQAFVEKAGFTDMYELLREKYVKEGLSLDRLEVWSKTVDKYGYTNTTWRNYLIEYGIKRRSRQRRKDVL